MKIRIVNIILLTIVLQGVFQIYAQVDSGVKRFTLSDAESYVSDTSGDGRFVLIQSNGDIATYNPRNSDRNFEIFLMDVAQRHIFQVTDTKSATQTTTCPQSPQSTIRLAIHNSDSMISNDGRWIVFSSNATTSVSSSQPNGTNPGNFDANIPANLQILQQDGNQELWLFQLPNFDLIDIPTGNVPNFVNLSAGVFTQITNTPTSRLPVDGNCSRSATIASDNRDTNINDDGSTIAFVSNRDLTPPLNSPNLNIDNDEVFVYKRNSNSFAQVSETPRGSLIHQIININPSISGDGLSVSFASTGTNSIRGMTNGSNTDFSFEVYYATLDSSTGEPNGIKRQVTNISQVNFEPALYLFPNSRSISRDGRYIVFMSSARLDTNGPVGQGFANFIYDAQNNSFTRFTPYDNADSGLPGGYIYQYPRFSDYASNSLSPNTVVFNSRLNLCANGSVPPACTTGGLNPASSRPVQVYSYNFTSSSPVIKRISNSPVMDPIQYGRCFSSNSSSRIACNLVNAGGTDKSGFYFLTPNSMQEDTTAMLQFYTGAGGLSINSNPPQAQGLMTGMLGSVVYSSPLIQYDSGFAQQVSNSRNFIAPLQLKEISLTIDGISANITGIVNGRINFIVPKDVTGGNKPVVINHKGMILRGNVQIVQTPQPDIVRTDNIPSVNLNYSELIPQSFGRARILDVTDPNNPKTEPFRTTTQTPSGTAPTKLRLFLTGVQGVTANAVTIKFGNVIVPNGSITTNAVETDYPGISTFDFEAPPQLAGAGHVPVMVTVNGVSSRPIETAPHTRFLTDQPVVTDLAVWRPGTGVWYVLDGNGANPIYVQWGSNGDIPAPGDYDGDGKTDFCIFRPSSGDWWLVRSSDNSTSTFHFGLTGDEVAQADYDGDHKTDFAVYRPSTGVWYLFQSSQGFAAISFGTSTDKHVPADYDGDGKADLAIFRPANGEWWIRLSTSGVVSVVPFGLSSDKPVIGDYDGDGLADLAVWRPSDGNWWIRSSNTSQIASVHWGNLTSDIPVQGDYDGDGKTDLAVWTSSGGLVGWWYINKSSTGQLYSEKWGTTGDIPVAAPW